MSDCQGWPDDWPGYRQACFSSEDDTCDMLVGPCACGAWHRVGEFELLFGVLLRSGQAVPMLPPWPERRKKLIDDHD